MKKQYTENQKLSELVCANYNLLSVMSRFGLSLGFGEQTVRMACEKQHVDTYTFLAIANYMEKRTSFDEASDDSPERAISLETLIFYLQQAHIYFLDFNLPTIRRKLLDALDYSQSELAFLILKFYDEYVNEVRKHMAYEDKVVFKYVSSLLKGEKPENYHIGIFEEKHDQIAEKLSDLKSIITKYYPSHANIHQINSVLFDIYSCENDLNLHCDVEDNIFVPLVKKLEKELESEPEKRMQIVKNILHPNASNVSKGATTEATDEQYTLSEREKEIVSCVAKGYTNKEMADKLFISAHTVITHRRNIARKLQIHSPAGLTIYAIVNKLVEIQEIR